ncbi:sulfotransferase [Patescibacteria group bacterium]
MGQIKRLIINSAQNALDRPLSKWEKSQFKKYNQNPNHKQIFIVGAPRTGSTFLYQTITNMYNISYVDNLTCFLYKNFLFGLHLSNTIFKEDPHNCYQSYYGKTTKLGGLHAPSECGNFWYRWFTKNYNSLNTKDFDNSIKEIRDNIYSAINKIDRPIIFKNMNFGQHLATLNEILPSSKIIWIKRDPTSTCLSLLLARKNIHQNLNTWWSVKPKEYDQIIKFKPIKQVVYQMYYLEKQINENIQVFNKLDVSTINYEDLIENPIKTVEGLNLKISKKPGYLEPAVVKSMAGEDPLYYKEIEDEVIKLDWHDYQSKTEIS